MQKMMRPGSLTKRIDSLRQLVVFTGNGITRIVGTQPDLYFVIGIGPGRMMVMRFGQYSHPGHKGKGFLKILKGKSTVKGVLFFCPHKNVLRG